jgi:tRNA(Phe) wybutosine-synthesizing methylase Tyw3
MNVFEKFKRGTKNIFMKLSCQSYLNEKKINSENSRALISRQYWEKVLRISNHVAMKTSRGMKVFYDAVLNFTLHWGE